MANYKHKRSGIVELEKRANWLRRTVFKTVVKAGPGHLAPSFSCIEILVALYYGGILNIDPNDQYWENRDRFILSKGHAAVALYVILADLGFFDISDLDKFIKEGGYLGSHAEDIVPGVEATTGSLGHGLSIATGIALGARMDEKKGITVALMGDGECHEGSVWEAAMFAAYHKLNNLTAIIDYNGLSATDFLKNYLGMEPFKEKWESFGWKTAVVNGHSIKELLSVLNKICVPAYDKPLAVIALTTKGKGVSFMENNPIWHYRVPVGEELDIALKELKIKGSDIEYETMD